MHGPVDTLPSPCNSLHFVVLGQSSLPQAEKESAFLPALKVGMNGTGTAEIAGQSLPLASRAQYINDGGKYLSGSHRLPAAAGSAKILMPFRSGKDRDERFNF